MYVNEGGERVRAITVLIGLVGSGLAHAQDIELARGAAGLLVSWPDAALEAHVDGRDLQAAQAFTAGRTPDTASADEAFVATWLWQEAGEPDQALRWLDKGLRSYTAPPDARGWLAAQVLSGNGQNDKALAAATGVPLGSIHGAQALGLRATLLSTSGREDEARQLVEDALQEDPSAVSPAILWSAANLGGRPDPALIQELYLSHPTSEEGKNARSILEDNDFQLTWEQATELGTRYMSASWYDTALEVTDPFVGKVAPDSELGCQFHYLRGRSHYKRNRLSKSVEAFGRAARACAEVAPEIGMKIAYLEGQAQYRRGRFDESAATYLLLPDLYAQTTYADDGLTRAGIALLEAERPQDAEAVWRRAVTDHPDGDTVPEATFRLAFTLYQRGATGEALTYADRLKTFPPSMDGVHVMAGWYWAARWRAWPDVKAPNKVTTDAASLAQAEDLLAEMVQTWPRHYYSLLAANRLRQLDPARAASIEIDLSQRPAEGWTVRSVFLSDKQVRSGIAMARLGLVPEGVQRWDRHGQEELTPEEHVYLAALRTEGGDWLGAHKYLHHVFKWRAMDEEGIDGPTVVRAVYPERYWEPLQKEASQYSFPPRLFHALVREESNFDREIKSFAGAIGLAQLMPATARTTAGWLGETSSLSKLIQADFNLMLGARYLESVYSTQGNSPFLALAGYNAGPNRVSRWVREWGNPPTDEFVERIPYRETRGYVKRVSSTWMVYRFTYGDGAQHPDLVYLMPHARPDLATP